MQEGRLGTRIRVGDDRVTHGAAGDCRFARIDAVTWLAIGSRSNNELFGRRIGRVDAAEWNVAPDERRTSADGDTIAAVADAERVGRRKRRHAELVDVLDVVLIGRA